MEAFSCAEILDLAPAGLMSGKCIDDSYINRVFGIDVTPKKDKSQRLECGCVVSKDIGAYDTVCMAAFIVMPVRCRQRIKTAENTVLILLL